MSMSSRRRRYSRITEPTSTASPVEAEPSAQSTGCAGCLTILGFIFLLGVVVYFVALLAGEDSTGSNRSEPDTAVLRQGACSVAHDFVRDRLRSPSSARFQNCRDVQIINTGNRWKVEGHVDAQNAFGATLRNRYVAILTYEGTTSGSMNWRLVSLDLVD